MRPVEHTSTSAAAHPSSPATSSHMRRASVRPASPVAAFALPELRTTAAAWPLRRCSRLTCTRQDGRPEVGREDPQPERPAAWSWRRARGQAPPALHPHTIPAASKPATPVMLMASGRLRSAVPLVRARLRCGSWLLVAFATAVPLVRARLRCGSWLLVAFAHGMIPRKGRPVGSGRSSTRLSAWMACPAAPFTRLSIAASASTESVLPS